MGTKVVCTGLVGVFEDSEGRLILDSTEEASLSLDVKVLVFADIWGQKIPGSKEGCWG